MTTTHCRHLFLLPTLSLDVVFDYRRFLPLRLNFYGYLHRRRKGRFLPSPLATASIRNRHSRRNASTRLPIHTASCAPRFRLQPLSIDAATCRRRFLSTPFSIDAVFYRRRFLSTPFSIDAVFYRCRNLSTPFSIDAIKFLPTPFVYCRHRFLSTLFPVDTDCYRYRFLPLPQPVDAVSIDAAFHRCRYY
jgi:hypothetical protein